MPCEAMATFVEGVTSLRGHKGDVLSLHASDAAALLISGSEDDTARLWDPRTGRAARCLSAPEFAGCVAFSLALLHLH